jgi:hypothetical protein
MIRGIVVLLSLAALATAASSLVIVDSDARTPGGMEFLSLAIPVYISTDFFIALSPEDSRVGSPRVEVLDSGNIRIEDYALVHLSSDEGLLYIADLGEILFHRARIALIKLDGPLTDHFARTGVLSIQPLRVVSPPSVYTPLLTDRGYDDYVADIVALVNEDSLKYNIQHLEDYLTRHSSTDNFDTAAQWVEDRLDSYGMNAFQQVFPMSSYDCENVIGEQQGNTYPDQYWIICGHLDCTSTNPYVDAPGADDNASGSAAVLEAARVLNQYEFKYSIRFLCFGGEEQGLWGSAYYASQASAAGDDILGVVNLDMILYGPPPDDILWVSYNAQSTGLGLAMEAISDTYVPALLTDVEYNPGMTASDHASFWNNGYAAVLGIEQEVYSNPFYHQTSDMLSNYLLYFPFGTNCTRSAIATIAYLAEPTGMVGIPEDEIALLEPGMLIQGIGPNPASGSVLIRLSSMNEGPVGISLFDLAGREVYTTSSGVSDGNVQIDISGMPAGVYSVRVSAASVSDTARLVVLR